MLKFRILNRTFSSRKSFDLNILTPNNSTSILSTGLELEFLGTSSARSTLTRNVSCVALRRIGGGVFLFDCGEGTVRQMLQSKISPHDVRGVFLTHLHGDHCYGVPGLGMTLLNSQKEDPLLVTPKGLEQCFTGPLGLRGFKVRPIQKPGAKVPPTPEGESIYFNHEDRSYLVYEDKQFIIKAAPIRHSVFCLGYVVIEKESRGNFNKEKMAEIGLEPGPQLKSLIEGKSIKLPSGTIIKPSDVMELPRKGRKVVILGDTCDPSGISHLAENADVLVHEATCSDEERTLALTYMHSTAGMAGEFARKINAKSLILTHFSPRNFHGNEFDECVHIRTLIEQARDKFKRSNVYPAHVRSLFFPHF